MAFPTTDSVQDIPMPDLTSSIPSNCLFRIREEAAFSEYPFILKK